MADKTPLKMTGAQQARLGWGLLIVGLICMGGVCALAGYAINQLS